MEVTQSIEISTEPSCYSLEALLLRAGIYSQQKIFTRVEGLVRVKGVVTKVSKYKTATYLTLKDQEFSISVKCDSGQDVYENESILVEGILYLKPSTFLSVWNAVSTATSWVLGRPLNEGSRRIIRYQKRSAS